MKKLLFLPLLLLMSCDESTFKVTCYSPDGKIVVQQETKEAYFNYGITKYRDDNGVLQEVNLDCKIEETRTYK